MRPLSPALVLTLGLAALAACGGSDGQLESTALAFEAANDARDAEACLDLVTTDGRAFYEAEREFQSMLLVEEDEPRSEATRSAKVVREDGDVAVVEVVTLRGGDERTSYLHLKQEDGAWRVDGFSAAAYGTVQRFADLVPDVRARIEKAKKERTPHPELGPIVEAYLAAAAAKDGAKMFALMTPECAERERTNRDAFTAGFLAGRFKVKKWHFAKHDVEGDEATQRIRTLLEDETGKLDGEPIRFRFARTDGGWVLTALD